MTTVRWREVARELAARMKHHAYCEQHPERIAGCAFCDDRAAYHRYLAAVDRAAQPGRKVSTENEADARRIVAAWWDWYKGQHDGAAPTGQRFHHCVTVVKQLLDNGWSEHDVKLALAKADAVTTIDLTKARNREARRHRGEIERQARVLANAGTPLSERGNFKVVDFSDIIDVEEA